MLQMFQLFRIHVTSVSLRYCESRLVLHMLQCAREAEEACVGSGRAGDVRAARAGRVGSSVGMKWSRPQGQTECSAGASGCMRSSGVRTLVLPLLFLYNFF
jgi:hypothetical protein